MSGIYGTFRTNNTRKGFFLCFAILTISFLPGNIYAFLNEQQPLSVEVSWEGPLLKYCGGFRKQYNAQKTEENRRLYDTILSLPALTPSTNCPGDTGLALAMEFSSIGMPVQKVTVRLSGCKKVFVERSGREYEITGALAKEIRAATGIDITRLPKPREPFTIFGHCEKQ